MRVLICGSRTWSERQPIHDLLRELQRQPESVTIVHGAAKGADEIAGSAAPSYGHRVEAFPAEWRALGKRAGYVRNAAMLASGIDHVYAFRSDGVSKGTDQMVALARDAGVPVTVRTLQEATP